MRRPTNSAVYDDDDEDEDHGIEEVNRTTENLKIFCCSSTEYLKLRGKLLKDGPPQVSELII